MTTLFVSIIAPIFVGCCIMLFRFWLEQRSKR